ncbi:SBDS family rRNA metabolism protein [Batrachochytrium salamandrivorans]|nr:SBDS family rRNA metabolism protein [Batrachochytrium salamandrivorans]
MSYSHQLTVSQERHTNISIVRIKKGGKKFEVAAYRNKVMSWRSGAETNLDEVLQVSNVFASVGKGIHAKREDLDKHFGKGLSQIEICKLILAKGEMQTGDKEREAELANKFRDIATIVASRCVNSQTGWPFTVSTIETAMKNTIHFVVNPTKAAKPQAFEVIEQLKKFMPIARARIHLKVKYDLVKYPNQESQLLLIAGEGSEILSKSSSLEFTELLANPSTFRELEQFVTDKLCGSLTILQFSEVSKSSDVDVDDMVLKSAISPSPSNGEEELEEPKVISLRKFNLGDLPMTVSAPANVPIKCNSCLVTFTSVPEQRAHHKTEFHTFNVKLKNTGLPVVTLDEFTKMSDEDKHSVLFDWKL